MLRGIEWILSNSKLQDGIVQNAKQFVQKNYSEGVIVSKYLSVYNDAIARQK